jgi:hypothetical protein
MVCEDCEHYLGTAPDWDGMRSEFPALRTKIFAGAAALVAMIAANMFVFGGAGYFITVAPIGWIASAAYRHHLLSKLLRNADTSITERNDSYEHAGNDVQNLQREQRSSKSGDDL